MVGKMVKTIKIKFKLENHFMGFFEIAITNPESDKDFFNIYNTAREVLIYSGMRKNHVFT